MSESASGPAGAPKPKPVLLYVLIGVGLLGLLAIPCGLFVIIPAIAIPNLISARKAGNEAAAIGALKTIATAQAIFREGDKDGNGKLDYAPSVGALEKVQLIDSVLGSGTKQGYLFVVTAGPDVEKQWSATASPVVPTTTGDRFFFVDETSVVHYELGKPATATSPIIGR